MSLLNHFFFFVFLFRIIQHQRKRVLDLFTDDILDLEIIGDTGEKGVVVVVVFYDMISQYYIILYYIILSKKMFSFSTPEEEEEE